MTGTYVPIEENYAQLVTVGALLSITTRDSSHSNSNTISLEDRQMSRATLLEETGTNLKMGDRVRLTEPLDYDGTPIGEGEEGTVLGGTPLGGVEIELDETHCGLAEWDNCVTLFDTELNHLECVTLASTVATCLATMGVDPIIAH